MLQGPHDKMNSSSITMQGMWQILGRSFPLSLWHLFFSSRRLLILRREREEGSPCFGKDLSFSRFKTYRVSREVIYWSPLLSKDLRFGKAPIVREVRVEGRNCSSGNDSNLSSLCPPIHKLLWKGSVCKPHSIRQATSFVAIPDVKER